MSQHSSAATSRRLWLALFLISRVDSTVLLVYFFAMSFSLLMCSLISGWIRFSAHSTPHRIRQISHSLTRLFCPTSMRRYNFNDKHVKCLFWLGFSETQSLHETFHTKKELSWVKGGKAPSSWGIVCAFFSAFHFSLSLFFWSGKNNYFCHISTLAMRKIKLFAWNVPFFAYAHSPHISCLVLERETLIIAIRTNLRTHEMMINGFKIEVHDKF